jgi:hypothetical protein
MQKPPRKKSATSFILREGDAAIVIRRDGEQKIFFPREKPEDCGVASDAAIEIVKLAIALSDRGVQKILNKKLCRKKK